MKKRVLKVLSALVLMFSFLLSGCISAGDASAFDAPSDDLTNASENANDIMKTSNNVTYYYESLIDLNKDKGLEAIDRNVVVSCFSAVYLFIDPGFDQEFNDHFSGTSQPFYRLVDREIDILSQALYELIDRIYINNSLLPSAVVSGNLNSTDSGTFKYDTNNIIIPIEKQITINDLQIINATTEYSDEEKTIISKKGSSELVSGTFDLRNIATYEIIANAYNASTDADGETIVKDFYIDNISATGTKEDGSTETISYPINNYMINLNKAIFGGYALEEVTSYTNEDVTYTVPIIDFSDDTYNDTYKWQFLTTYGLSSDSSDSEIETDLKNELKYRIASAVSGKSISGEYDETKYIELLKAIDHTGFTEQDQANIVSQILNNVIGTDVVNIDKSFVNEINRYFSVSGESLSITSSKSVFESLFIKESGETNEGIYAFQHYKAYELIIEELVEQATTISCTHIDGTTEETLVPRLPRLQVIIVDPRKFMDAVGYEEENGEVDDYEEIDPDEIPTDTEGTEFTRKLLQSVNLKAVLFLPKQVYGERTIAKKDGDTWVEDEDGEQVYDTFIVTGFVVTSVDVVLLADEGTEAVVQGNYVAKSTTSDTTGNKKTTVKEVQSEAFEVGNELPDPTVEESYSSTDFLEIDGTEFMAKQEDEAMSETDPTTTQDLRMQGYDGLVITELGLIMNPNLEEGISAVSTATVSTLGLYKVFTFSTDMYKYLSADSVAGEGAGYTLNIDEFAGDNYVLVDFSVLQVNDDESNRECKFNILYLSCETT